MVTKEVIFEMQAQIRRSIRCLNNGGCIHFAYYFSAALKTANVPHTIVLTNEDPIDLRYQHFQSVSHVMVHIPEIGYLDGYDYYPTERSYFGTWDIERYRRHVKLSNKKLNNFRNNYTWNPSYSRAQNVQLEKIIRKYINGTRRSIRKKG